MRFVLNLALFLLPAAAWAQDGQPPEPEPPRAVPAEVSKVAQTPRDETPPILRLIIRPLKRGMMVRLPIIDTDPNRGVTVGFMPIWVIQEKGTDRIEHIHAPSITYNKVFGPIPTYRYYYYPTETSTLNMRASLSTQEEREAFGLFEDENFLGRRLVFSYKIQYNVDGAKRFYGLGPDSPKSSEANYVEDILQSKVSAGMPIRRESRWKVHANNNLFALRMKNGRTPNLAPFPRTFPGVAPVRRQQTNELGLRLDYDTRDHGVTTGRGAYVNAAWSSSVRGLASAQDYSRYGLDGRVFYPWPRNPGRVTAAQARYDQVLGTPPFWLQPSLGGKYSLRAYGEGRYVDRGALALNLEQRFTLWKVKMAGVTTELETAPFVGMGTVFDNPGRMARRYFRPVVGLATRAVAKPQVVGSLDFGVGREGLAAFMDINYSF